MKTEKFTKKDVEWIKGYREGKEIGRAEALAEVEKIINKLARDSWDCRYNCGCVNNECDNCKVCGANKWSSFCNGKLNDLLEQIKWEKGK